MSFIRSTGMVGAGDDSAAGGGATVAHPASDSADRAMMMGFMTIPCDLRMSGLVPEAVLADNPDVPHLRSARAHGRAGQW